MQPKLTSQQWIERLAPIVAAILMAIATALRNDLPTPAYVMVLIFGMIAVGYFLWRQTEDPRLNPDRFKQRSHHNFPMMLPPTYDRHASPFKIRVNQIIFCVGIFLLGWNTSNFTHSLLHGETIGWLRVTDFLIPVGMIVAAWSTIHIAHHRGN